MEVRKRGDDADDRSSSSPDLRQGQIHDLPAPGPQGPGPFVGVRGRQGGAGRDKAAGLIRECREELAVTLDVGEVFMEVTHEYPDLTAHLTLFHAAIREGVPQKLEHNEIRWITVGEINQYEFCPADETILDRLRKGYLRP